MRNITKLYRHDIITMEFDNFTSIKCGIVGIATAIVTFLAPIANDLQAMMLLFLTNIVVGLLADIVQGGKWEKKKMVNAVTSIIIFLLLVLFVYTIGYLKHEQEKAVVVVCYIGWVFIWFYGTNILRNLKQIFKEGTIESRIVSFLYDVMSLEVIKHIPFLQSYLARTTNQNTESDENIS